MPFDFFRNFARSLISPPEEGQPIVPDNAQDITVTRCLNVRVSGTVRVTLKRQNDGEHIDLYVAAGTAFPARVKRVWATGTDAEGIVGLW